MIFLLFSFICLSYCNLNESVKLFDIIVTYIKENEVGKKGLAGILTEFSDDQNLFNKTDIEENIIFN